MDKFYVIDPTNNLNELENDYTNWMNLPYEIRMRSNDECIRRYGVTNFKLYEKLKSNIVQNISNDKNDEIVANIQEDINMDPGLNVDNDAIAYIKSVKDDKEKFELTMAYNNDPNIAIIYPAGNVDIVEELNRKYYSLTSKYRRISNGYSMSIWGYNVPNMYLICKSIALSTEDLLYAPDTINITEDVSEFLAPIKDKMDKYLAEDNKIGLLKIKLDSCSKNIKPVDRMIYEGFNRVISNYVDVNDFSDSIKSVVPYFTIDEMRKMGRSYKISNPDNYYYELKEAIISNDEDKILDLGWNPSVILNNESIEFAREKQIMWADRRCPRIVDISHMYTENANILNESSAKMRKQYEDNKLYPVYIVLSYTDTFFGHIIRRVTKSTFTHAGIALDSDLKKIYTFKYETETHEDGARVEDLAWYLHKTQDAIIAVFTFFVGPKVYKIIKDKIEFFVNNSDNTKYSFTNIVNIFLNRSLANDPMNMSMVCSQFVDTILRVANINLVNKTSNLVLPQDYYTTNNPKVFKIYEGYVKDYKDKSIEKIISALFASKSKRQLTYKDAVMEMALYENNIDKYDVSITDNNEADNIIQDIENLLLPEEYICERSLPIKVDDKTVTIEFSKTLEEEYQDAHRLLLSYDNKNDIGIKHELARLYYIVITIEKKIKTLAKGDKDYRTLINLRARCLNDFKKYFKVANKEGFDFYDYYKTTEYNTNNLTIDTGIFSFVGSLIGKIIGKK